MDWIIYHEVKKGVACPDGIMAAAIARMAIPGAKLIGDSYRHESEYGDTPDVEGFAPELGDRVFIVDFSYPAAWLNRWVEAGIEVTIIDHHAPKFPQLEGFSGAILDADECGATLTWRHFFPDRAQPEILHHVRNRDIGANDYYKAPENCRDSKAITAALSKIRYEQPDEIATCQEWLRWDERGLRELQNIGEGILEEEEKTAQFVADQAVPAFLCGHLCGKVQTAKLHDRLASQIGNAIALAHPEWNFAWIVASDGEGNSLRSANGFDVSAIATEMGGGGHKAAAEFKSLS